MIDYLHVEVLLSKAVLIVIEAVRMDRADCTIIWYEAVCTENVEFIWVQAPEITVVFH